MFTGIVEELGTIAAAGARMNIKCRTVLEDTHEGSSIAVNGVCLTATSVDTSGFWCDLSPETLARTNLGAALRLVADEMKMPPLSPRSLPPAIVLISDGRPTDEILHDILIDEGLELKPQVVRQLADFEVLVPAEGVVAKR